MNIKIEKSWEDVLAGEFDKTYFKKLTKFIDGEYCNTVVYPPLKNVFNAFSLCDFNNIRVVILGQDPYHNTGQADGLAFSVPDTVTVPPSLVNIYKEIESDMGYKVSKVGNLEYLAKQGVLLLNATLTVQAHMPASHQGKGWEEFTDAVIEKLSNEKEHLVFLLWGAYAQKKGKIIDRKKHLVLETVHPSPLSAYRGFLGCKHFSKTNEYLIENNIKPINWTT